MLSGRWPRRIIRCLRRRLTVEEIRSQKWRFSATVLARWWRQRCCCARRVVVLLPRDIRVRLMVQMMVVAAAADRARLRDDALVVAVGHAAVRVVRRRSFYCVCIIATEVLVGVGGR